MLKNILLTGAAGFVGRNLLERLVNRDYNVRCIVMDKKKLNSIKKFNSEVIIGDITKKDTIKDCMRGIDAVFHLAAMINVSECLENPAKAFETNTVGTLNLLNEAKKETDKSGKEILFVYLSSDRVYGNAKAKIVKEETPAEPLDPYSVSKFNSELLLKSYNLCSGSISYTILRSASIYGYGQPKKFFIASVINQILKGKKEIKIGNVGYYRNFVHIEDLISALVMVLGNKKKFRNSTFNVSESSRKIKQVADSIKKISLNKLNKNIRFIKHSSLKRPKSVEFNKWTLDCSKISKMGWKPKMSFEEGIKKTFEAYLRKNG